MSEIKHSQDASMTQALTGRTFFKIIIVIIIIIIIFVIVVVIIITIIVDI